MTLPLTTGHLISNQKLPFDYKGFRLRDDLLFL